MKKKHQLRYAVKHYNAKIFFNFLFNKSLNVSIFSSSSVFLMSRFIFLLCFVIPLPVLLYSCYGNHCLCNRADYLGQLTMSLFTKC